MDNSTDNPTEPTNNPGDQEPSAPSGEVSTAPTVPAEPAVTPDVSPTPPQQPAPAVVGQAPKRTGSKLLKLVVVILLVIVLAAVAAKMTVLKSSAPAAPKTTLKEAPLLRIGTIEGPIGPSDIFPKGAVTQESQSISYQIYEGLVGYQGQKIAPLLATSWTTPDKNTWVFELEHNIKFQNGKTMTAADVKASIDAVMKNDYWGQYTITIASVSVSGTNEVTIKTTQPDALLLDRLANVFVFSANADGTDSGTGPYTLDPAKPSSDSSANLVAFNDYHGGRPKTQALAYTVFDGTTQMSDAFKANKIDTYESNADAKTLAAYKTAGNTSLTYDAPGSHGIVLNIARPGGVLANKQVREAINYAIDRPAYVKQIAGNFEPTQSLVPQAVIGYSSSALFPGFDLAKSKALQTSAGYPNGVPLNFLYIKDVQIDAPVLIDQLKAAGFQVTANAVASPKDAVAAIKAGTFDLVTQTYFTSFNDATDMFTSMLDGAKSDFGVYNNPDFDKLITASEQEFDPAAHIQKVQAINKYIVDNTLWIPVRTSTSAVYSRGDFNSVNANFVSGIDTTFYWRVGQTITVPAQ